MTLVIVAQGARVYGGPMVRAALRLIAMLALVLMPLGMTAGPAHAQPGAEAHSAPADSHCASDVGHNEEVPDTDRDMDMAGHCAGCASLLASFAGGAGDGLKPNTPEPARLASLGDLVPEIATPPPKLG